MLILPASKVSVPLTVVMRTRSKAPPNDGETPALNCVPVDVTKDKILEDVHVLLFCKHSVIFPLFTDDAAMKELTISPAVEVTLPTELVTRLEEEEYPDVVTEPEPI